MRSCPSPDGLDRLLEGLRTVQADAGAAVAVGVSTVCVGEAAVADAFEEARHALLGATVLRREPAVMSYDELGPYRYLLRIALDPAVRDVTIDAVSKLAAYDSNRGAALLQTLDEFLGRRGSITATSEALYVHPNTLRQRLRRIGEISGIDLRHDDWLTVEIAVKLVRLRAALSMAAFDTEPPPRLEQSPVPARVTRVVGQSGYPRGGGGGMAKSASTLDEIKRVGKERGIEFYFAQFVDLYGRPSAKLVPAANLDDLVAEGAGFAGFAAGDIGQVPSDPDIAAMPDLDSFTPVPWQSNLARFACDITVEGEPWPYCPRTILRNV